MHSNLLTQDEQHFQNIYKKKDGKKKDQRFDEQKTEPSEFCYSWCQSADWTVEEPTLQTVCVQN